MDEIQPERLGDGIANFQATAANANALVTEARQALADLLSGKLAIAATVGGVTMHIQVQKVNVVA